MHEHAGEGGHAFVQVRPGCDPLVVPAKMQFVFLSCCAPATQPWMAAAGKKGRNTDGTTVCLQD
jgi:hypothetical protein